MHCAMVRLDGEKMSKSLGNLVLVRTLLAEGYSPDAIRALLLSHHYREEWEYNEEEMRASAALVARLVAAARLAEGDMSGAAEAELGLRQARLEFTAALEDDFHTERALSVLDRLAQSVLIDRSAPCAAGLKELAQQVMGFTLAATPAQRQGSAAAEAAQPAG
jgi:L-cysteine:1D-myo-inositol 2-amino-2-deoxy-alpha-D-glucopyranoside ligase